MQALTNLNIINHNVEEYEFEDIEGDVNNDSEEVEVGVTAETESEDAEVKFKAKGELEDGQVSVVSKQGSGDVKTENNALDPKDKYWRRLIDQSYKLFIFILQASF